MSELSGIDLAMPAQPVSAEVQEAIKRSCDDLRKLAQQVFQKDIGFDDASIQWLASVIEFSRMRPEGQAKKALSERISCFLGAALIAKYGGEWVTADGGALGVRLPQGTIAFPFSKVAKQFANGQADSIWGMYKNTEVILRINSDPQGGCS